MTLDTSAYIALAQGVESIVDLIKGVHDLILPLPAIAELRYGFAKGSKLEHNEKILQRFLAQSQVEIAIPTLKTTQYYADLQLFCVQHGRVLSQNDIWIASLAKETNDKLVSFDKDFKIFAEILNDKLIIL